jgi:hypothetical protein
VGRKWEAHRNNGSIEVELEGAHLVLHVIQVVLLDERQEKRIN